MGNYNKEPLVDEYINSLPAWQKAICSHVRDLVHRADSEVIESIKRRVQPYFVLNGNICALLATKDHVNVFIYDPTVPDPDGIINQGHGNLTARSIQIKDNQTTNDDALLAMFKLIIARNRKGGWRKLEK